MKDFIDSWIKRTNWKIGNFSLLPIAFGTVMALVDMCMMGGIKMVHNGTLPPVLGVVLSSAVYLLQPLIFLKAMNYQGMAVTNLVWNLISNTIVTLQGVLIFGESIKGLRWVAMAMGLVSLGLFAYSQDD